MKYLLVIDVQNDFVTGSLGTREAQQMLPRLLDKVRRFEGTVWMTQDSHTEHYLETQEGKMLPVPHCIMGTEGWRLVPALEVLRDERRAKVYEKPCFGSIRMVEDLKRAYDTGAVEAVELVGLCTDICVVSNALMLKAAMPELPIYVDASCCAGVDPQKHEAALTVMESCQIMVRR